VHVLQGEREMASANKSLGRFDLADIPPSPRGMPQIEVTLDLDANGILNVSAKDKATGKQQSIVIKASSGLSEDEIDKMIRDAEAHVEEDRKFHETVAARNQADNLIHGAEKSLRDLGDKVDPDERKQVENAIAELREAMKGDDKDAIEAKTASLSEASAKIAERAYAQNQDGGDKPASDEANAKKSDTDDVVDAEFEEVDDRKK